MRTNGTLGVKAMTARKNRVIMQIGRLLRARHGTTVELDIESFYPMTEEELVRVRKFLVPLCAGEQYMTLSLADSTKSRWLGDTAPPDEVNDRLKESTQSLVRIGGLRYRIDGSPWREIFIIQRATQRTYRVSGAWLDQIGVALSDEQIQAALDGTDYKPERETRLDVLEKRVLAVGMAVDALLEWAELAGMERVGTTETVDRDDSGGGPEAAHREAVGHGDQQSGGGPPQGAGA